MFPSAVSRQTLPWLLIAIGLTLQIVACVPATREPPTTLDKWSFAVLDRNYDAAQGLMMPEDGAQWRDQTVQQVEMNGAPKSYERGDISLTDGSSATRVIVTWANGS